MCGRYAQSLDALEVQQAFNNYNIQVTEVVDKSKQHTSYNVCPTRTAPTYRITADGHKAIQYMSWGLVPSWQKKKSEANQFKTFNARKESILEGSRMWASVRKHKRCVVPIQGYYEWLHKPIQGAGKKVDKIPYFIRRKDQKLMFLAGLYDHTSFEDTKEELHTFTIITGPAPKQLKWLHDRMPIVLTPGTEEWETWLSEDEWTDKVAGTLKSYEKNDLEWFEVTRDVGKVSNDGAYLIKPIKESGIHSFFKKKDKDTEKSGVKKEVKVEDKLDTNGLKNEEGSNVEGKLVEDVKEEAEDIKQEVKKEEIKKENKDNNVKQETEDDGGKKRENESISERVHRDTKRTKH